MNNQENIYFKEERSYSVEEDTIPRNIEYDYDIDECTYTYRFENENETVVLDYYSLEEAYELLCELD